MGKNKALILRLEAAIQTLHMFHAARKKLRHIYLFSLFFHHLSPAQIIPSLQFFSHVPYSVLFICTVLLPIKLFPISLFLKRILLLSLRFLQTSSPAIQIHLQLLQNLGINVPSLPNCPRTSQCQHPNCHSKLLRHLLTAASVLF